MVAFVEEDVAAIGMWLETEDGHTDDLQLLPSNEVLFVMCSP
jgi:hypothetical protein